LVAKGRGITSPYHGPIRKKKKKGGEEKLRYEGKKKGELLCPYAFPRQKRLGRGEREGENQESIAYQQSNNMGKRG